MSEQTVKQKVEEEVRTIASSMAEAILMTGGSFKGMTKERSSLLLELVLGELVELWIKETGSRIKAAKDEGPCKRCRQISESALDFHARAMGVMDRYETKLKELEAHGA